MQGQTNGQPAGPADHQTGAYAPGQALMTSDPETWELCRAEERRQAEKIRLIPSENHVSKAVLEASASVFTNKYSEGYPRKRYYEGQQLVDPLEQLNRNAVPFDPRKPFDPSGIRLGTPAMTSRGMREGDARQIAAWIDRVISQPTDDVAERVLGEVRELTRKFPAPGIG